MYADMHRLFLINHIIIKVIKFLISSKTYVHEDRCQCLMQCEKYSGRGHCMPMQTQHVTV